eukprot:CAMPEP_0174987396 /NCGR_PEP_ID=MMETSP0004_2-20121128/19526_1 /TAXON_ID=420556 /ORGANISM="Ochromonas sp., Strain CCMP1393" /LENGTH=93 /DNA_ID=CAMNT_0016240455 /DNA_START=714 /DNA_END=995 /DNA_ORIENTATION=+
MTANQFPNLRRTYQSRLRPLVTHRQKNGSRNGQKQLTHDSADFSDQYACKADEYVIRRRRLSYYKVLSVQLLLLIMSALMAFGTHADTMQLGA